MLQIMYVFFCVIALLSIRTHKAFPFVQMNQAKLRLVNSTLESKCSVFTNNLKLMSLVSVGVKPLNVWSYFMFRVPDQLKTIIDLFLLFSMQERVQ
jgi:hypothetical protein